MAPDGETCFPEGVNFLYESPRGEVITVKVLTDSGASISCVRSEWVENMALSTHRGPRITVTGVTNGRLALDDYVTLKLACPLRPEVSIEFTLLVLPGIGMWKCRVPQKPRGLKRFGSYLADPDVIGKEETLTFPILAGGRYMSQLKMTAVYFNKDFALVDSVDGLIPRGMWPSDAVSEEIEGFRYRLTYQALVGLAQDEPEIISVQPMDDKVEKPISAPATALSMEDLELNQAILDSLRQDRMELDGVLASEEKLTVKEKFKCYLTSVHIEDNRIILPLPKSSGFPHKVRANHRYGELCSRHLRKFLEESPYAPVYINQVGQGIDQGKLVKTSLEELRAKGVEYSELTHHAVQQPEKPAFPIRVVINGNSKEPNGYSPNDWLDPGVNLLPLILSIIFYVRNKRFYLSADISKAKRRIFPKHKVDPPEWATKLGHEPSLKPYRILGCGFDPATGLFYVLLNRLLEFADKPRITKRLAWGLVARFYDLLGLGTGCQLGLEKLRQELDDKHPKAPWGYLLTKRETAKWHNMVNEFTTLRELKVPRFICCDDKFKGSTCWQRTRVQMRSARLYI